MILHSKSTNNEQTILNIPNNAIWSIHLQGDATPFKWRIDLRVVMDDKLYDFNIAEDISYEKANELQIQMLDGMNCDRVIELKGGELNVV